MTREGLRSMLAEQAGLEVVADAGDGRSALRLAAEAGVDVAVMDVTMAGLNGIEATRRIKAEHPAVRVVGLSMHADREFVTAMLAAGASAYVLKDCPFAELVTAIRAVAAGEVYLSPKVAGIVVGGCLEGMAGVAGPYCGGKLTAREREVLQLVADGKSSKQIAMLLKLSAKTVDTHRRQVMDKLGLHSVAELTHYAIREGVTALR
jgi:DNA-binding NarL/FixJ family response regulator